MAAPTTSRISKPMIIKRVRNALPIVFSLVPAVNSLANITGRTLPNKKSKSVLFVAEIPRSLG
jgi:hypothetical protein